MSNCRSVFRFTSLGCALSLCFAAAPAVGAEERSDSARLRELEEKLRALEKRTAPPSTEPAADAPLAVREPPFTPQDFSWMNGSNRQPATLLSLGPVDFSALVDVYYLWQFHRPNDHTAFPSSVAPRHNEVGLNLASLGVDLSRLSLTSAGGPIGRLFLQYGSLTETTGGQDATTRRGFFTSGAFQFIREAAAGWHFNALHGVNVEVGIFPSYIAMESYLPQENWNYLHPFVSDFTPYYFAGSRTQLYPRRDLKLELWIVNGWQSYSQWHEGRGGGYLVHWRPREWLTATHAVYVGQEARGDDDALRFYTDNYVQARLYKGDAKAALRSLSVAVVADYGYEKRGNAPSGHITGYSLSLRAEWGEKWATALRGDVFYDQTQALVTQLPGGQPLPGAGAFLGGGGTLTVDFLPSPWLLLRLEYMHRESNVPYFSGAGGITGPGGVQAQSATFTPELRTHDDRAVFSMTLRL